ncbi:MAG: RNA-binding domain-containing protein [Candidatus Paceibacterota bacterium]|jgi:ATP-dependent DNA helicase RecG
MENESEILEYKESLSEIEEAGECLTGFANKNGGRVCFGVKNNGEVIGISNITEKTLRDISQRYVDNTEPKLIPKIEAEMKSGLNVISVSIEKSSTPYHTYKKRPFIRIGTETKAMSQDEYQKRLIAYKDLNQDFSAKKINNVQLDDLSPEAMLDLRKLLKVSGRFKVSIDKLSDEQLLRDLQLLRDGKLTVAALVLLAKPSTLSRIMPYVEIRYSFKLNESEMRTQDIEIFNGGYLLYYDKIWEKINARNITLSVPQGLLIRDVKAFDEESIREAINNTIIHRDYSLNESTFVTQYQQKIEVKSPGGLVDGVSIENILDESKTRNKLIADTLFKTEFVEHLGN